MKPSVSMHAKCLALAAGSLLSLSACSEWRSVEDLPAATISSLQTSGQVLPFNRLNSDVLTRHPGGQVEHAALDKIGERYLYQAQVTDPNKMQWFVELDAKTGEVVTDRQDAH